MNSASLIRLTSAWGWVIVTAGSLGAFATYWDEAWHTDIGRDSAWALPHLLLYGSVGLVGVVVAGWGLLALQRTRSLRTVVTDLPLLSAGLGGLGALVAAPIDAAWHTAYGRDAVLWSPPHMLVVMASTALLLGVLSAVPNDATALRVGLGMLVLANAIAVVFEYEADVPQFSENLYLPILLVVGLLSTALLQQVTPDRYAVAKTVGAYIALRLAIAVGLAALGRSTPDLPFAELGLIALDVTILGKAYKFAAAAAATSSLALGASFVGLSSVSTEAVAVLALPVIGATLLWGLLHVRRLSPVAVSLVLVLGASAALITRPGPAYAHDPGQGQQLSTVTMEATIGAGPRAWVRVSTPSCNGLTPKRLVARRAGVEITSPLAGVSTGPSEADASDVQTCAFSGSVRLPTPGRWFIYAEFREGTRSAETWVPLVASKANHVSDHRSLYVPAGGATRASSTQYLAGTAVYLFGLLLLAAGVAASRRGRLVVRT